MKVKQFIAIMSPWHGKTGNLRRIFIMLMTVVIVALTTSFSWSLMPQKYEKMPTMKKDGFFFHSYYPPKTPKDEAVSPVVEMIEKYLSEKNYKKAKKLVHDQLRELKRNSPRLDKPEGEMYSIYIYCSLKYWQHMLQVMDEVQQGNYSRLQKYTGTIVSIDWGSGRNSSGHMTLMGSEGEKEFFGSSDFLIEKNGSMQKGKKATAIYEVTESLDNPNVMVMVIFE